MKIYSIVLVKQKPEYVTHVQLFTGMYKDFEEALAVALAKNEGHTYHIHTTFEIPATKKKSSN